MPGLRGRDPAGWELHGLEALATLDRHAAVRGRPGLRRSSDGLRHTSPLTPGRGRFEVDGLPTDDPPFPFEAARDLVGIAHALYAAFNAMGKGYDTQLNRVSSIGILLTRAIEKPQKGGPGEQADLGELVDVYLPAKQLIAASGGRLRKR